MDYTRRKGVHKVEVRPLSCLIHVYGSNSSALYPEFVEETSAALPRVKTNESAIISKYFKTVYTFGNDTGLWKGVVGQRDDTDVNDNGKLLLQLCCNNALCIVNSEHLPTQMFVQVHLVQRFVRWLTGLCLISAELIQSVLDFHVNRDAEPSTDHRL